MEERQCWVHSTHGPHEWGRLYINEPQPYQCAGMRIVDHMRVEFGDFTEYNISTYPGPRWGYWVRRITQWLRATVQP